MLSLTVCVIISMGALPYITVDVSAAENTEPTYSGISAIGVWHRPNASGKETSLEGICSVLDQMSAAGVNMVFLETFYHGMSVFKSNLVPYYKGFERYDYSPYPDYLTAFATEAEKRGIEVHAWVENFYVGVDGEATLIKYHPDWMLVNESGKINHTTEGAELGGYLFLDPANPEVREYLLDFYDELLTKVPAVKGLNLDYIRYPVSDFSAGTDTGYTDITMDGFAKKYGFTVDENDKLRDFKAKVKSKSLVKAWIAYRADFVTSFVGEVSDMVNTKHPESIISVAVHPNITNAYNHNKQDFTAWVEKGYIDVVTPMLYFSTGQQVSSALNTMLAKFSGVYCYSGLYATFHGRSIKELRSHIDSSKLPGTGGFILFESTKTFFNPANDYAGYLNEAFGGADRRYALPHWSTDRLIAATTDAVVKYLTENGESEDAIASFVSKMERIGSIGEGSSEKLETTIGEITSFRQSGFSSAFSENSSDFIVGKLGELVSYLELRKSRLDFKGYPDSGVDEPDDSENDGNHDDNGQPSDKDDGKPTGLFGFIEMIINGIINWFKNLFIHRR